MNGQIDSSMASNEEDLRANPQLRQILNRLKTSSTEERKKVFADLKKTPHLFAAFLKMKTNSNKTQQNPDLAMPGSSGPQQYFNQSNS
jgi:hypothetical protein